MSRNTRMLRFAAGTALASVMLGGCATQSAPRPDLSASRAEVALKGGKVSSAIAHAEAAVLADPRNASYRTMLGAAYLEAGRFLSARTSFDDALTLGDETPRTALGFALASIAIGDRASALEVLEDWRDDIPAADLGLALALAGQSDQGVAILSNAVRSGDETPKTRQNLAYALALNGNWGAARIMAAQDVPLDKLDARMAQWATTARSEDSQGRIAALLRTQVVADSGQPAQLALANHPTNEQLASEAAAYAPLVADASSTSDGGELPAVSAAAFEPTTTEAQPVLAVASPPVGAPEDFQSAFAQPAPSGATPAQMIASAVEFAGQPVVQQTPTRLGAAEPAKYSRGNGAASAIQAGDHLVQLGSFSSEAGARRAWGIYAKKFPQLSQFDMVITKAVVKGKTYYRVSAGGIARADAGSFCSTAKRQGQGCIAWSTSRPLPGAVDTGVRMARR